MLVLKRLAVLTALMVAGLVIGGAGFAGTAWAGSGQPSPWQIGFQESATPVMEFITQFHNWLLVIITVITLFVLALLIVVIVKFNAKANPTPSHTTHNTFIEVVWTLAPVIILVGIAIPSFKLLFMQTILPPADITIKATGKQWYWSYAYPDSNFEFDSLMLKDNVVPVNKNIRVQTIGADVIHAFAVPSFGIKIDAVPGRLNETWFKAVREGVYYGQCSELCGKDHAYMPIAVRVVSEKDYATWLDQAKKKYAAIDGTRAANVLAAK